MAVLVLVIVGAAVRWAPFRHVGDSVRPGANPWIDQEVLRDSLEARTQRQDWEGLVQIGERLILDRPRDVGSLLVLSKWWQNLGRAQRTSGARVRSATRTSIDHMRCETRALMYADSALRLAERPEQRADASGRRAEIIAGLGLPLDALDAYRLAASADPASREYSFRVAAYEAFLRDPLHSHSVAASPPSPR